VRAGLVELPVALRQLGRRPSLSVGRLGYRAATHSPKPPRMVSVCHAAELGAGVPWMAGRRSHVDSEGAGTGTLETSICLCAEGRYTPQAAYMRRALHAAGATCAGGGGYMPAGGHLPQAAKGRRPP